MTQSRNILLGNEASGQPVVFVAMPTGQVLANLLALFELVEPDDHVIWLATGDAVRRGWLARSQAVLKERCPAVSQHALQDLSETLDGWGEAFADFARKIMVRTPVLIINGGTKLLNYAVAEAFRRAGRSQYPVAYASTFRPPGLMLQPEGHGGSATRVDYGPERFPRLAEVLAASGHQLAAHNRGTCLWRAGSPPAPVQPQAYGSDSDVTFRMHADTFARVVRGRQPVDAIPTFRHAQLDEQQCARLRDAVNIYQRRNGTDEALAEIFNAFRKVGQVSARRLKAQAERLNTLPQPKEGERLNDLFEAAVAARMIALLEARPELARLVGEVWRNVEITPVDRTDSAPTEFDVLILTRHGSALVLECKSGLGLYDPETDSLSKDMHAREYRLSRSASGIAKLVVCLPAYRTAIGLDWQDDILNSWRKSLLGRHEVAFFTLPDDPGGVVETTDGPLDVPGFDATLATLIAAT